MKKRRQSLIIFASIFLFCSCSAIENRLEPTIEARVLSGVDEGIKTKVANFTEVPSNTPYSTFTAFPTFTPYPTYTPKIVIVTATFTSTPKHTPTITMTPTNTSTPTNTPDVTKMEKPDGFYLVNTEIAPGVWRSNGDQDNCYWEITTSTGNIINNHFGMAGGTMYIQSSAFQVMLEDCGKWTYLGE